MKILITEFMEAKSVEMLTLGDPCHGPASDRAPPQG